MKTILQRFDADGLRWKLFVGLPETTEEIDANGGVDLAFGVALNDKPIPIWGFPSTGWTSPSYFMEKIFGEGKEPRASEFLVPYLVLCSIKGNDLLAVRPYLHGYLEDAFDGMFERGLQWTAKFRTLLVNEANFEC